MTRLPLFLAVAFLGGCAAADVSQHLMTIDCDGGIYLLQGSKAEVTINATSVKKFYNSLMASVRGRITDTQCPSLSTTEFDRRWNPLSPEMWLNRLRQTPADVPDMMGAQSTGFFPSSSAASQTGTTYSWGDDSVIHAQDYGSYGSPEEAGVVDPQNIINGGGLTGQFCAPGYPNTTADGNACNQMASYFDWLLDGQAISLAQDLSAQCSWESIAAGNGCALEYTTRFLATSTGGASTLQLAADKCPGSSTPFLSLWFKQDARDGTFADAGKPCAAAADCSSGMCEQITSWDAGANGTEVIKTLKSMLLLDDWATTDDGSYLGMLKNFFKSYVFGVSGDVDTSPSLSVCVPFKIPANQPEDNLPLRDCTYSSTTTTGSGASAVRTMSVSCTRLSGWDGTLSGGANEGVNVFNTKNSYFGSVNLMDAVYENIPGAGSVRNIFTWSCDNTAYVTLADGLGLAIKAPIIQSAMMAMDSWMYWLERKAPGSITLTDYITSFRVWQMPLWLKQVSSSGFSSVAGNWTYKDWAPTGFSDTTMTMPSTCQYSVDSSTGQPATSCKFKYNVSSLFGNVAVDAQVAVTSCPNSPSGLPAVGVGFTSDAYTNMFSPLSTCNSNADCGTGYTCKDEIMTVDPKPNGMVSDPYSPPIDTSGSSSTPSPPLTCGADTCAGADSCVVTAAPTVPLYGSAGQNPHSVSCDTSGICQHIGNDTCRQLSGITHQGYISLNVYCVVPQSGSLPATANTTLNTTSSCQYMNTYVVGARTGGRRTVDADTVSDAEEQPAQETAVKEEGSQGRKLLQYLGTGMTYCPPSIYQGYGKDWMKYVPVAVGNCYETPSTFPSYCGQMILPLSSYDIMRGTSVGCFRPVPSLYLPFIDPVDISFLPSTITNLLPTADNYQSVSDFANNFKPHGPDLPQGPITDSMDVIGAYARGCGYTSAAEMTKDYKNIEISMTGGPAASVTTADQKVCIPDVLAAAPTEAQMTSMTESTSRSENGHTYLTMVGMAPTNTSAIYVPAPFTQPTTEPSYVITTTVSLAGVTMAQFDDTAQLAFRRTVLSGLLGQDSASTVTLSDITIASVVVARRDVSVVTNVDAGTSSTVADTLSNNLNTVVTASGTNSFAKQLKDTAAAAGSTAFDNTEVTVTARPQTQTVAPGGAAPESPSSSSSSSNVGVIVGCVVGAVVLVALIVVGIYYFQGSKTENVKANIDTEMKDGDVDSVVGRV